LSRPVMVADAAVQEPVTVGVGVAVPAGVGDGLGVEVGDSTGVGVPGVPTPPQTGHNPRLFAFASCSAAAMRAWCFTSGG
jgi:hypothetical protein